MSELGIQQKALGRKDSIPGNQWLLGCTIQSLFIALTITFRCLLPAETLSNGHADLLVCQMASSFVDIRSVYSFGRFSC